MFNPVPEDIKFASLEKDILEFWRKHDTFKKSLDIRKDSPYYSFYDGPPFATGLPHYGHLLAGTIKDILPRYWTMKGYYVERRFGWDCHGLPVEHEMENTLGLSGKIDIEKFGIAKFNEECRSIVLRYTSEWQNVVERMGRWVDFINDYKTMDTSYMESIWWVFKQLWDKGLVYEGKKVLPYCMHCSTPLSNFEANLNYQMVTDPAITVKFKSEDRDNTYFLAWTTTPWTLPSNLALAVGKDIPYLLVRDKENNEQYFLAETIIQNYYRSTEEYEILERFKGNDLVGKHYIPLFPYFKEKREEKAFRVILGDFVDTESGTGIVHIAPAFGEDDNRVCHENHITLVDPVDASGFFTSEVTDFAGKYVKDADKEILQYLKEKKLIVKRETYNHSYPFCWRSETPLIYKAISTWFVNVEKIKDDLVNNNKSINWVPEHLKEGRFGKWIANAKDWAISRNRFWGNTIPIWRCEECGETLCIGSIKELEEKSSQKITDLHKHYVDEVTFKCTKCSGTMKRVAEVFDCWFESGSMPYAQLHYPFENKTVFENSFPSDFIAEGLDQTRGWFYTLLVLSTSLFNKPAFKNVVVNGLVLAEDGKKMSKKLKNYPDPMEVINTYGADALRLYLINSAVVRGEDLKFSEAGVKEMVRSVLLPFWNAYTFFMTYAIVDKWDPQKNYNPNPSSELDRWVLSKLQSMLLHIENHMEAYRLYRVVPTLVEFIDDLTNWYIRRSRRRFWKSSQDEDKYSAYSTLYTVLLEFSKVLAPFLPFLSEYIYSNLSQGLKEKDRMESVHLSLYPRANEKYVDTSLEKQMELVRIVVNLGRSIRKQADLKIRQPLSDLTIISRNKDNLDPIVEMVDLIKDELNIKEIKFSQNEENLVELSVKANFKALGSRAGKQMKALAEEIQKIDSVTVRKIEDGQTVNLLGIDVSISDLIVERKPIGKMLVMSDGGLTVAINSHLSEELINEGIARDFINRVQKMRKEAKFNVDDRIQVNYSANDNIQKAVKHYENYIKQETLANEIDKTISNKGFIQEHDIENEKINIEIIKC